MLNAVLPSTPASARDKLLSLLDYVEQVVRLDERVAFDLADYKLADGKAVRFTRADTGALPGVTHDAADNHGPVWLSVERLARSAPPAPPPDLADWVSVSPDPARPPELRRERTVRLDEATRLLRMSAGACAERFERLADEALEDGGAAPPAYRQTLVLAEQPSIEARLVRWIADSWAVWAAMEGPRRRTIALYERLYALVQNLEASGAEAAIEVVWGIGIVRWRHGGRSIQRPLLECPVDVELDEASAGTIRVRPTSGEATSDLKPYEELGVPNLAPLEDLIRREIDRAAAQDGISPFRRESFEPILAAAAVRLQPDGLYRPGEGGGQPGETLTIDDAWVLFARPRSGHVLLADIDRLRTAAREPDRPVDGIALRLVTEPSRAAATDWTPLSTTLGESAAPESPDEPVTLASDVFFPKPFNDDQIAIVRRLARSDGLVVQGPPGTGKTHTIANLICHAMATGQRVLVVSRGEAALSVLRDQLPEKVRPLAIALLSNERQGLGQVEAAIRTIQSVVEGSRPEIRHAAIRRCEAEIVKTRARLAAIDAELDLLATAEFGRIGQRGETPAELARRVASKRETHGWFTDRPAAYLADTGLTDADLRDLAAARGRAGDLLDHLEAALPSPADLPTAEAVAGWHAAILRAVEMAHRAAHGPAAGLVLTAGDADAGAALAVALDGLADTEDALASRPWLRPFLSGAQAGRSDPYADFLHQLCADWTEAQAARASVLAAAVELPPALIDDAEGREAVARGARGEKLWPLLALGKGGAKARVAAVRARGAPVREADAAAWQAVEAALRAADRKRDVDARWQGFAREAGAPGPADAEDLAALVEALRHWSAAESAFEALAAQRAILPPLAGLAAHPAEARALAAQLRFSVEAARLQRAQVEVNRLRQLFESGEDRTSGIVRRFLHEVLGRADVEMTRIEATWAGLRQHLERLRDRADDFATVVATTARIAAAGAPAWAERLRREPASADAQHALIPVTWRDAWDHAAAEADLARRNKRERFSALANQRVELERTTQRLFVELVRERTFYMLDRRLSPSVKSALVEFVRALGRLGKGTGRSAGKQRRAAREAMRRCYDAVPCWIMPTWRVAEQLPSDLSAFDLVILDEASQSDVTELPAVLRGRKILVVGDDRQVSPGIPFVAQGKIDALRRRHLKGLPFQALLEPGESLYTLMQAVFPDERLMLKEHFRCVEPIIRFSMGFYPETLLPLRVPAAAERLDPPLVDIYVPHGEREKNRKINRAEADVIVEEIARIATTPGMEGRSIGVISLIGGEQAGFVRELLAARLGAEILQRHRVLCGDSATFQGNERDIVFLSMVADRSRQTALTMLRYAQRFNVAMSRGRDRAVLVRSVQREDLNPADLKARLIQHFEQPMPVVAARDASDPMERCESGFERDVLRRLLERNYRVEPQVGALGFRIDMVIEGDGGRRLAVECDGDAFHGPEQWREDMRRQRVLERVGWRFWRCFASSFYADPDGTLRDLVDTLTRAGIDPRPDGEEAAGPSPWVEHRVVAAPSMEETARQDGGAQHERPARPQSDAPGETPRPAAAAPGHRMTLVFAGDHKPLTVTLTDKLEDLSQGLVATTSPLGTALIGREEDDEVELPFGTELRTAIVERIERSEVKQRF